MPLGLAKQSRPFLPPLSDVPDFHDRYALFSIALSLCFYRLAFVTFPNCMISTFFSPLLPLRSYRLVFLVFPNFMFITLPSPLLPLRCYHLPF